VLILEVLGGPFDGTTWEFEQEIVIGRDESVAGACLPLDRFVSRKHARVRRDGDGLILTDLSSRNGTRVGGRVVSSETAVSIGEPFVVGRTQLRVIERG